MDYYEEQEAKAKEKLEEERYQEAYQKQAKISRIILLATFLPSGLVFIIVGISFLLSSIEKEASIAFLGIGTFFCLFGIVLYFVMPKKGNYQKYKAVIKKRGGLIK